MINLSNMRVSELVEHLFSIYQNIFMKGITDEREMLFANALMDYNRRALVNSMNLGLQEGMLPIAEVSVWQHTSEGDDAFYTVRVETVGGKHGEDANLGILVNMIQETINKWGDESFDGTVSVSGSYDDDMSGAGWILPNKKRKNEE